MKGVTYHTGSPISGHYRAAVKLEERWWNCNDAVVKIMEERKVVRKLLYPFLQPTVRIFENCNVRKNFWSASAFWPNVIDLPDCVYLEV